MATGLHAKIDPIELYDRDFYAWSRHQAETLRQFQTTRPNLPLDFEHLIEEVEDWGESRVRAARSPVRRLMQHLLKLQHSRTLQPRRQWLNTIDDARAELQSALTATIGNTVGAELEALYDIARRAAVRDLLDHDEPEAAATLPETCPYTLDLLLDEAWRPTNRHGLVDEPF